MSVPAEMASVFTRAEDYVRRYFAERSEDPEKASILISDERYLLVRAASLSVEFFDSVVSLYADRGHAEATAVAKGLLFDLAHAIGAADARAFHRRMGVEDPVDRLSAGPVHFAFSGWASVSILPESRATPDESYYLIYDHPFSFESDSWQRHGRKSDFPVCVMNAGYSSGWCEESFGLPLVAAEVECAACGDGQCRFIMAPPSRIEEHLAAYARRRSSAGRLDDRYAPVTVPEFFQRKRLEDERDRIQAALQATNEELERRVAERTLDLEKANRELKAQIVERELAEEERRKVQVKLQDAQKLESLGVLAGGLAHDFNNLLVGILGNTGMLAQDLPPDSPHRQTLAEIEAAATRAAALTAQMLAYAGQGRLERQPMDLSALIAGMKSLLATAAKGVTVRYDLEESGCTVEADPALLRQVVMNLVVNASEAVGDSPGAIGISTGRQRADRAFLSDAQLGAGLEEGEYVYLEVADEGHGMHASTVARIFDPFFTTKFTGRGLGLAAVLGIVRSHSGCIRVTSQPGKGTSARVLLPCVAPLGTDDAVSAELSGAGATAAAGRTATVLVVDDEESVRTVAGRILERAGFAVKLAAGGLEALRLVREQGEVFDAVLLDATMPDMHGTLVLVEIRRIRPGLRVLLSSGYSSEDTLSRVTGEGPEGFVQKPYGPKDLVAAVRRVMA